VGSVVVLAGLNVLMITKHIVMTRMNVKNSFQIHMIFKHTVPKIWMLRNYINNHKRSTCDLSRHKISARSTLNTTVTLM